MFVLDAARRKRAWPLRLLRRPRRSKSTEKKCHDRRPIGRAMLKAPGLADRRCCGQRIISPAAASALSLAPMDHRTSIPKVRARFGTTSTVCLPTVAHSRPWRMCARISSWRPIVRNAFRTKRCGASSEGGTVGGPFAGGSTALKSQPFSALIGAKLTSLSEGKAVLEVPIREELRQQNGYVHGGVISYIADNALTFANGETLVARASVRSTQAGGRPCAAAKSSPLARVGKKGSARLRGALASPCRLRGRRNERRASLPASRSTTDGRSDRSSPLSDRQLPRSRALRALPTLRQEHRPLQLATGPKGGARRCCPPNTPCSPNSPARTAGVSL